MKLPCRTKILANGNGKMLALCALAVVSIVLFPEKSFAADPLDFISAKFAIGVLCEMMMGPLGGLLVTVAGVGAIVAAAFGNFRASQGLIVVAVGAFSISAILSLSFPDAAKLCVASSGSSTARSAADTDSTDSQNRSAFGITDSEINVAIGRQANFSDGVSYPQGEIPEREISVSNDPSESVPSQVQDLADSF